MKWRSESASVCADVGQNVQCKRKRKARDFYGTFVEDTVAEEEIDKALSLCQKYAYYMPQHMGGKKRSKRIAQQIKKAMHLGIELLDKLPLQQMEDEMYLPLQQLQQTTVDQTTTAAPNAAPNNVAPERQLLRPLNQCKPAKKRRFIQFVYEMMGCPPEFFPDMTPCWDGKYGVINKIRGLLGLHNSRSRLRIRSVLEFIQECLDQGLSEFDAGVKRHGHNSGRKHKLTEEDNRTVAKCLRLDLGLEMTHTIVNHKRGDDNEVSLSTIRRSAHTAFGGKCHNRATKKTGSRDVDSPWTNGHKQFGLQLQL